MLQGTTVAVLAVCPNAAYKRSLSQAGSIVVKCLTGMRYFYMCVRSEKLTDSIFLTSPTMHQ